MRNRYAGSCTYCGARVRANAGRLVRVGEKLVPAHLACGDARNARVVEIRIGDTVLTQNSRGRCEDAPCCGCCTC